MSTAVKVLRWSLLGAMAAASSPALAEVDLWTAAFVAGNLARESSEQKSLEGTSFEAGVTATTAIFAVDFFVKHVKFTESSTDSDGSVTKFAFSDKIAGVGGRFLGRGYFLKLGRALHDATSAKTRDGQSVEGETTPNGRDAGLYFGAGLWLPLASGIEVFGDFTRYQLPTARYKIDEVSFGVRVALGEGGHRAIGK